MAPAFADGRCGIVAKIHHALVDGRSAVEVAQLLFDVEPNGAAELPVPWEAPPAPGSTRLAARAVAMGAEESLRAARGAARMAGEPRAAVSRIAGTLRRAALAAGEDLLRPAPASVLNARIGPRRTLVRHSVSFGHVKEVLGAELVEAHPVVPIPQGHALSIGIFSYLDRLHFGFYADPHAFGQARDLPQAFDSALRELLLPPGVQRKRARPRGRALSSPSRAGMAAAGPR